MTETTARLENGWRPDTPVEDTLLRRFVYNQADLNAATARALGGRVTHTDDVWLADAGVGVPYLNQAVLARPLTGPEDEVLDAVEGFFAASGHGSGETPSHPVTMLSIWPTADLSGRGWSLAGHPVLVARAPSPVADHRREDVAVRLATTPADLAAAERIAVEGFPLDDARGLPAGRILPPALCEAGITVRLGLFDGEPVAMGNAFTARGVTQLCLAATLPSGRRRGVWEALVWARVDDASDLPAVAYTSDCSRPGFIRMGFLPVTRLTLWYR
jgi:hypothetical protein